MTAVFGSWSLTSDPYPICFEDLQEDVVAHNAAQENASPTFHAFHRSCLAKWVIRNNRCPLCRESIDLASLAKVDEKVYKVMLYAMGYGLATSLFVAGIRKISPISFYLGNQSSEELHLEAFHATMAMVSGIATLIFMSRHSPFPRWLPLLLSIVISEFMS